MIIDTLDINKARILLKKENKPRIVKAQNLEFNRKMLEKADFEILLSPENNTEKTKIKSIDSGLNHVLCRIAEKRKIAIGIDINALRELNKKVKAERLEKIVQNIKLCRKYKVTLALTGIKDKLDADAFLLSLGASTQQIKKALTFYVKFHEK